MEKLEINKKVKNACRMGNLGSKTFTSVLNLLGYSNSHISAVEVREKAYRYIKKKYSKYISRYEPSQDIIETRKKTNEKTIWVCWWQGEENAPQIVKRCISTIRNYENDWNIQLISKENYLEYVMFPDYIISKWDKGIISNTHMSDLLRLELLIRYGGLWVDATVFLTGEIPAYIFEKKLFMFKVMNTENHRVEYNNWFIYSIPNNELLKTTRYLLYKFWETENKTREYFLWHIMMTRILEYHPEYADSIYYIPDELAHILGRNILKQYDERYWEILKSLTTVHKLTTKCNNAVPFKGTYYEKILNGDL